MDMNDAEATGKRTSYILELEKLLVKKDLQIQQALENPHHPSVKIPLVSTKIPIISSRLAGNNKENDLNPRIKQLNSRILLLEGEKTVLASDLAEIRTIVCSLCINYQVRPL
jgi:hypothetical protein